jgi:hypothetical protein
MTKPMQQGLPYKAICRSAVHYRVHNSYLFKYALNKITTVTQCIFVIYVRITLISMPVSAKWLFNFRLSEQNFIHISHIYHAWYTVCPPYSIFFIL